MVRPSFFGLRVTPRARRSGLFWQRRREVRTRSGIWRKARRSLMSREGVETFSQSPTAV
ncbi:MAG: hypothetical protein P8J87_02400 [Verrucomicrobiales bacterium]|nr:hypothetical protein [Verrucomicrobiales bacterium]